jgi:hypothetical protein
MTAGGTVHVRHALPFVRRFHAHQRLSSQLRESTVLIAAPAANANQDTSCSTPASA